MKILVSAGEASGDLYAAALVRKLRERLPGAEFFGCAGPRMVEAGVTPVVDAHSLAVVGLVEVVRDIPRIRKEFRKLAAAAARERPDLAILTDSPDFNLRLAKRLKRLGIPVVYLVAPQVWAWRSGRIHTMRRNIDRLLCIFPFEEKFFCDRGVRAAYIGHPLSRLVRPALSREEFFARLQLDPARPLVALLPGSRTGEVRRHLPHLEDAAARIRASSRAQIVLALPAGGFVERNPERSIQVVVGETWDVLARADVALAASGTVTVEAALLGTPLVVFYKVTGLSWLAGKLLVRVPFYSMVNLVAGRPAVPELMQNEMSGRRLAEEALRLLADTAARDRMRQDLAEVAARLNSGADPMERAAGIVEEFVKSNQSR